MPKSKIEKLREDLAVIVSEGVDSENDHFRADELLVEYIGDEAVTALYKNIGKWYA